MEKFYDCSFSLVDIILTATVGIILSAIYSLANLRQIFFGSAEEETVTDKILSDLRPREGLIVACLLVLVIGIGIYPKLVTDVFETKITAMTAGINQTQVIASLSQADARVNE